MLKNTLAEYGWIAIALHWLVAVAAVGLFVLGLWMTGLEYYDAWYERGPDLHKGIGVLLFIAVTFRLVWRWSNPVPRPEPTHTAWEHRLAGIAHALLYILLFATMLAGYLISTADGRPIEVFDLFAVPATLSGLDNQEDIAGEIHELLAYMLIGLTILHTLAALKHHFIDRDRTLTRMLGCSDQSTQP
ncbi:MAG: cytochrome b [Gammaproteobacteria bacterium]|nr:cytochrome b [Gammaproteobacteria bacterium]